MNIKRVMGYVALAVAAAGFVAVAEEVPWVYKIEDHPLVVTHSASATSVSPWMVGGLSARVRSSSASATSVSPWMVGGLSARVRSSMKGDGYNVVTTPNGMFIVIH